MCRSSPRVRVVLACCVSCLLSGGPAHGFGPDGHRIAGILAQRYLCTEARSRIARLAQGEGLDAVGLWADGVRSQARWAHTAAWHYINIADDESLRDHATPIEGDVLWAIEHFTDQLGNAASDAARLEALRFLSHFLVDLHQPLHVGRASDRGGNRIEVRFRGQVSNLHRFWDTEVIALEGLAPERYAAALAPMAAIGATGWASGSPRDWAAESQALRDQVYGFRHAGDWAELDDDYLLAASKAIEMRLAQAGVRLARHLNGIFC